MLKNTFKNLKLKTNQKVQKKCKMKSIRFYIVGDRIVYVVLGKKLCIRNNKRKIYNILLENFPVAFVFFIIIFFI